MIDVRSAVGRRWWTLERFGLTPSKLLRRLASRGGPRVFCISVPKAGTHLLERALCLHPRLSRKLLPTIRSNNLRRLGGLERVVRRLHPGQVAMSHLHFDPGADDLLRRAGIPSIFLVRDPRDVLVSEAFYLASGDTKHRLHQMFAGQPTVKDRIMLLLRGDPEHGVVATGTKLQRYAGWLDSGALVVRFEALVGSAGGGDDAVRASTLRAILDHVGLPADDAMVARIGDALFSSKSPTFHRGSIGQWRAHFDPEIHAEFERTTGPAAALYGYPDGDDA
jgi:hypothetical protein